MHQLSLSTVPNWVPWNGKWVPGSVDTLCPSCGRMVTLTVSGHLQDAARNAVSASARCPACSATAHFWIIEPGDAKDSAQRGCRALCVYPRPRVMREAIIAGDKLTPALYRAYQSAIGAYNAGLWDACAVSCRRTLEGLIHSLLGEEGSKEPLFQQLRSLPEKVDLAKPFISLADNLRKGGNVAAHFDLDTEPDQQMAVAMLDLLDYLLEYVYVLEEKARDLEKRLDSLG